MPLIDVSDVLSDPDFATTFVVTRNTTVPVGGVNTVASTATTPTIGVVEPANSNDLLRLPDADRVQGAIAIFTTFRLQPKDLVAWGGAAYTVMTTDDWSQFGAGYIKALCSLQTI